MAFKPHRHEEILGELTALLDRAEERGELAEFFAAYADLAERSLDGEDRSSRLTLFADALRPNLYAKMILREVLRLADEDERFIELEHSVQDAFERLRTRLREDRTEP